MTTHQNNIDNEKSNCYNCICKPVCFQVRDLTTKSLNSWNEYVKQCGCEHYKPKLHEDTVVLTKSQYEMLIALSSYEGSIDQLKNTVILSKEEFDELSTISKRIDDQTISKIVEETIEKIYQSYKKEYGEIYNVGLTLLKIIIEKQFGIDIKE